MALSNTSPSHSLGLEGAKVAAETESSVPSSLGQPVANIDLVSITNEPTEFFGNFNPYMTDPLSEESWDPPKVMENYIGEYFDRSLSEQDRTNVMVSLPRPESDLLKTPQLDEEVRKFLAYDLKDKYLNNPLNLSYSRFKICYLEYLVLYSAYGQIYLTRQRVYLILRSFKLFKRPLFC